MIGVLPHYGNDTEAAEIALVQIGKPAVAQLTSRLDKTTAQDGGLQFQLITILGKIGKSAATAEKSVMRVLNSTNNADISNTRLRRPCRSSGTKNGKGALLSKSTLPTHLVTHNVTAFRYRVCIHDPMSNNLQLTRSL